MRNALQLVAIALLCISCYSSFTQIRHDADQMTGRQSVQTGVFAHESPGGGFNAQFTRVEGASGTLVEIFVRGWQCNDSTLEIRVDGAYHVLESVSGRDFRVSRIGSTYVTSLTAYFLMPDSVSVRSNSRIAMQLCGAYQVIDADSIPRIAQVHNERFTQGPHPYSTQQSYRPQHQRMP